MTVNRDTVNKDNGIGENTGNKPEKNNSREIGGYLEMESFLGEEFYPNLHKLNLGRTSFVWLLDNISHDRVFLPAYICDSVNESAINAGYKLVPYSLDEDLRPVWKGEKPTDDDIFYLVNFYGQLRPQEIEEYRDSYATVIVDNAQAFYDAPVEGVHTIYSARKFFGLTDGAYVASDMDASADELPWDRSGDRVRYLVGRMENTAREFYSHMLASSDSFSREIPRRMSLFTENMLRAIDYEAIRVKRCQNYETIAGLLPNSNPFNRNIPTCPFAYPYYHEDGVALRKYLAERDIFIPTLWSFLMDKMPEDSPEHRWSANILSLPIDQRYDEDDMKLMADTILNYRR